MKHTRPIARHQVIENHGYWNSRCLIGTPTTGVIRYEWAAARFGQIIPTNWSAASMDTRVYNQYPESCAPLKFLVADAQNIIVREAITQNVEWLILIEQDNVLPPDCFLKFNEYMRNKTVPVVSGLYFTKSNPPEPMVYRSMGDSFYTGWRLGDKVWCGGVPTGTLLIHCSLLKALWEESAEYEVSGQRVRRVFETPEKVWTDPRGVQMRVGTSDLEWCRRIKDEGIFAKAGWPAFQKKQYPFLVDTGILVRHIDLEGRLFPLTMPAEYLPKTNAKRSA